MEVLILLLIIFFGFIGGLAYFRFRESRYLKKGVKDALGEGLRREIQKEQKDALRRKAKFNEKMKKFQV